MKILWGTRLWWCSCQFKWTWTLNIVQSVASLMRFQHKHRALNKIFIDNMLHFMHCTALATISYWILYIAYVKWTCVPVASQIGYSFSVHKSCMLCVRYFHTIFTKKMFSWCKELNMERMAHTSQRRNRFCETVRNGKKG